MHKLKYKEHSLELSSRGQFHQFSTVQLLIFFIISLLIVQSRVVKEELIALVIFYNQFLLKLVVGIHKIFKGNEEKSVHEDIDETL
jgi:hypothetical protein